MGLSDSKITVWKFPQRNRNDTFIWVHNFSISINTEQTEHLWKWILSLVQKTERSFQIIKNFILIYIFTFFFLWPKIPTDFIFRHMEELLKMSQICLITCFRLWREWNSHKKISDFFLSSLKQSSWGRFSTGFIWSCTLIWPNGMSTLSTLKMESIA